MNSETKRIGNYDLLRELARGSFGRVYLARHSVLTNRIVAIKLMLSAPLASSEKQESFLQEARFLEMLKHPHILPIIDVSLHEDIPYLVTEYASAGSLRDRLRHRLPHLLAMEESLKVLLQIGQALHYAHQQQIIHRDLKPENILFNAQGDALLTDFGISTMLSTASIKNVDNGGTPAYMAPEQFRGIISKESDQYALGCIAYELFTGHTPFRAPDFFALGFKHLMESPLAPTEYTPQLPSHISQAILKALAKDRTNRYPDAWAFIKALQVPPISEEAIPSRSETEIPTVPSTSHHIAASVFPADLSPSATVPPNPLFRQDGKQEHAALLTPENRSHASPLAQTNPTGPYEWVGQKQIIERSNEEAFSVLEPYKQSIIPAHQGPVTPFPLTIQDIVPLTVQGEMAGKNTRRRTLVILIAASLVLLVSLVSVLFFVLPSASSSNSVSRATSTQPLVPTSQNSTLTQTSKLTLPATPTEKAKQSSTPSSQHAATSTPQPTSTSTAASTPTPTTAPTPTPTPTPQLTETLTVPFIDGTSGVSTQYSYSGTVQVTVSGTGQAASTQWSDAFYRYTDRSGNPLNPPDHASCWVMYINSQPTDTFVSTPTYQSSHSYTFMMTAPGGTLSFGVCDGVTTDNTGSYTITVTQD
jgi:serine/threonine protein kinase